jgi:Mrp family chromosome partitioning ATPase/capsular polysaccharide biosynthesis protein
VELSEYPRMIKRRWVAIAIVTGIMLVFAWLTAPSASQAARQRREEISFRATNTMLADQNSQRQLDRWALLATTGAVPQSVARKFDAKVSPANVEGGGAAKQNVARTRVFNIGPTAVRVTTDPSSNSLAVTATAAGRARAEAVANDLAATLRQGIRKDAVDAYNFEVLAAATAVSQARSNAEAAHYQSLSGDPNDKVAYKTSIDELTQAQQDLASLQKQGPPKSPLSELSTAHAQRQVAVTGIQAPRGRNTRLLLGAVLGLVLGLGLAMILERLDASVRGVAGAEAAAGLPVIAEIPHVRIRKGTRYDIFSLTMPKSLFAEAYRGMRTSISLMTMAQATGAQVASAHAVGGEDIVVAPEPQVILVASPGPSEGKSTTSANLATTYAGMGSNVVVIDLDFRRQKLHRFFHTTPTPHLTNTGTRENPDIDFDGLIQPTSVPGVRFLASAPRHTVPEEALLLARAAIAKARVVADVVILDAPPLLLTNDAKDLIPFADALVLLARDGRTHRKALERASQLLRRLDAPVLGLGLIESRSGGDYGYYRYGYGYNYGYGYTQNKRPKTRLTRETKFDEATMADEQETKRRGLRVWPRR